MNTDIQANGHRLDSNNTDAKSENTHAIMASLAVLAALAPIHPSVQEVLFNNKIPSEIIPLLVSPFFAVWIVKNKVRKTEFYFFALILVFSTFMVSRSLFSPNFLSAGSLPSLRSLIVILPFSMITALIASRNVCSTLTTIKFLSGIALADFTINTILIESSAGMGTFSAIGHINGKANYQSTAFYIGIFAVSSFISTIQSQTKTLLHVIFTLIALISLLIIGARSTAVAFILTAIGSLIFLKSGRRKNLIYCYLSFIIISIFIIIILNEDIRNYAYQHLLFIERFKILFDSEDQSSRLWLYSSSIVHWLSSWHAVFIGSGLGSFPIFIQATGPGWYPHNFFLETLAEGGIIGLTLLAPLLIFAIRAFIKSLAHSIEHNSQLCAFAIYVLLTYQFIGGLVTVWIPLFFLLLSVFSYQRSNA